MATPRPAFGLTKQIIITTKQSRIDWHYGTWATLAIALEMIVPNIRKKGKLFGVVNEDPNSKEPVIEYWFRDGIEDADAVLYTPEVGVNTNSSQIGEVTVNSVTSEVNIALHPSGENFVMINGVKVTKTVAEAPIAFIPVTEGKLKSIIIYGKTDAQMIYVAEGIEGVEAIDPDYDGLLIKRIVAKSTGVVIVPAVDGFVKLTGTEVGKPITGDLEIFTASGETKGLKSRVNGTPYYSYVGFDDDGSPLMEYTSFTGYYTRLNLYNDSLILGSDDPNFRGIEGTQYYGNTIGDRYFVQQKYVNDKIASITVDLTAYYTRTEVDSLLTSTYKAKGSVNNFSSLPTTGQREGDVWNTIDTGDNYVWVLNLNNTGNAGWDKLGGLVDLTAYQTTLAADSKYQLKGAYLLAADIANKVDKVTGKSLILNTEIDRLSNVTNQVIINDLITGGTTAALSAQQGVVLNNKIIGINKESININTILSIDSNTTDANGVPQNNKNVIIYNGVNNINIQLRETSPNDFNAYYFKAGAGSITFTLYYLDNTTSVLSMYTAIMNGAIGSEATVQRIGSIFYIKIYNA